MQSLQFGAMYPSRVSKVVTICGTSKTSPGTMAVRLLQREVIALTGGDATGFKLAKKLATLYYRSPEDINGKCDWYPRQQKAGEETRVIGDDDGVVCKTGAEEGSDEEVQHDGRKGQTEDSSSTPAAKGAAATTSNDETAQRSFDSGKTKKSGKDRTDLPTFRTVDGHEEYSFDIQNYLEHVAQSSLGYNPDCYLNLSTCMDLMELGSFVEVPGNFGGRKCQYRKKSAFDRITADVLVMGVKQVGRF